MAIVSSRFFSRICFPKNQCGIFRRFKTALPDFDTVTEVRKRGYECEPHEVTTPDGYNLTLHRVKSSCPDVGGRGPVLIQHGLFCASSCWVLMTGSLAYRLADEGCDVWLGNTRGNLYSRSHVSLSPHDAKFWDFSWHEMGLHDLPSMIDYILEATSEKRLTYIGHSQGTTVFFVMTSIKPEYNEKIKSMFGLAPVVGFENMGSILLKLQAKHWNKIHRKANAVGISHVTFEARDASSNLIRSFEGGFARLLKITIEILVPMPWSYPCEELRDKTSELWELNLRNGMSLKQWAHFCQSVRGDHWFHHYDHGAEGNLELYGQPTPPPYPLDRITTPVTLLYGNADWLADRDDVRILYEALKTDKELIEMPLPLYNHLDFAWSRECMGYIVNIMLKTT